VAIGDPFPGPKHELQDEVNNFNAAVMAVVLIDGRLH